ncbi:MAG: 30S ribosomal protein S9 [Candidatus Paceibacterota bacterium]
MAKTKNLKYYEAVGRRKASIARVRLYIARGKSQITVLGSSIKKGQICVNSKSIDDYFQNIMAQYKYKLPLEFADSVDRFAISVLVHGGGKQGQLDAIVLGLARALEKVDGSYRPKLKKKKLLTRDPRVKERRKPGTGGKARRKKQSPKR